MGKNRGVRIMAGLVAGAAWVVLGLMHSPAEAHGPPTSTSPRDGAVLESAPPNVRMKFNEVVLKADLLAFAPDGTTVPTSKVRVDGPTISARIAAPKQRGRWTIAYRVATADGFTAANVITFRTSSGAKVKQVDPAGSPGVAEPSAGAPRVNLVFAALAVVAGLVPVLIMVLLSLRRDSRPS